jgi:hypothetical protein
MNNRWKWIATGLLVGLIVLMLGLLLLISIVNCNGCEPGYSYQQNLPAIVATNNAVDTAIASTQTASASH